jgi:hypothetical protein
MRCLTTPDPEEPDMQTSPLLLTQRILGNQEDLGAGVEQSPPGQLRPAAIDGGQYHHDQARQCAHPNQAQRLRVRRPGSHRVFGPVSGLTTDLTTDLISGLTSGLTSDRTEPRQPAFSKVQLAGSGAGRTGSAGQQDAQRARQTQQGSETAERLHDDPEDRGIGRGPTRWTQREQPADGRESGGRHRPGKRLPPPAGTPGIDRYAAGYGHGRWIKSGV